MMSGVGRVAHCPALVTQPVNRFASWSTWLDQVVKQESGCAECRQPLPLL